MTFKAFVQVGRAVLINSGPEANKLGVIVEIISEKLVPFPSRSLSNPQTVTLF